MFIDRTKMTEVRAHEFIADASDLRIPPGIIHQELDTNIGNGLPLRVVFACEDYVKYKQQLGCILLKVFND